MPQNLLAELRTRRSRIQEEMRIRLDELDRLIALVDDSPLPNPSPAQSGGKSPRRQRHKEVKVADIIERPILQGLMNAESLTTKEMSALVPGKKLGPLVSAWTRRAERAGLVFDELLKRHVTASGDKAFSLTPDGRRIFGGVLQAQHDVADTRLWTPQG